MKLSPRESEVIELVRLGLTTKDIAERLNLSPKTINIHRYHAYRKLGLKTIRQQLADT